MMVHVDTKENRRVKLRIQREVVKEKVFPSRIANSYKPYSTESAFKKN